MKLPTSLTLRNLWAASRSGSRDNPTKGIYNTEVDEVGTRAKHTKIKEQQSTGERQHPQRNDKGGANLLVELLKEV